MCAASRSPFRLRTRSRSRMRPMTTIGRLCLVSSPFADVDRWAIKSPPRIFTNPSLGPSTNLVQSGRKRAHLTGLFTPVHAGPSPLARSSFPRRHVASTWPTFPNTGSNLHSKRSSSRRLPFFCPLFFFLLSLPSPLSPSPPPCDDVASSLFRIGWGRGCCRNCRPPENVSSR
jgi:hypothetical protein